MPLRILTAAELAKRKQKPVRPKLDNPYVAFLAGLKVGQGGTVSVAEEGVSRQALKMRLTKAAKDAGVKIKYLRTGLEEIAFEVVDAVPGRRRMT